MKKILLLGAAAIMAAGAMQAKTAEELRLYINPGHGNYGPNDRPMATIPYPMLPETGRPDSAGFYESTTNLYRSLPMKEKLMQMGVKESNIMFSRVANGPYPYVSGSPENNKFDRSLSEICEEVDANNMDFFISVHSNAGPEGGTTNYPLILYRGTDGDGGDLATGSRAMAQAMWAPHYMDEIDPQSFYSRTNQNVRGDISFYGSSATRHGTKGDYTGYLGVLKHGVPGFLIEGYFHTYQPARHRALNKDYCRQDAIRMSRGLCDYFKLTPDTKGYIMGTVKDLHEKIVNELFHYAPATNDQWLPVNGANVNLLKDGKVVKTYHVDNLYNGVFVFENLEPGNYTIQATATGYKQQGDYTKVATTTEYQGYVATSIAPYVVKANETTYAKVYLESSTYEPPKVNYQNYPDPVQPTVAALPEAINFGQDNGTDFALAGTIKRMLVRGDSTIILTNDNKTPHLYLINNTTKKLIKEMSTTGIVSVDADNAGDFSPLNDIAFTADGQLVGVNAIRCQFGNDQVDAGYKRGTIRFYKWQDADADPITWVTSQSSANFYRADMGYGLAVSGASNDCKVITTGTTTGSSRGTRMLILSVADNTVVSTQFTEKTIATGNFSDTKNGKNKQLLVSPFSDSNWVIEGEACLPTEFKPANASNIDSEITGQFSDNQLNVAANGIQFFKYAKHILMVTPYMADANVAGVKLYDVTQGLAQATLVTTTGLDLATAQGVAPQAPAAPVTFMAAGAQVNDADITLYLALDNKIVKFASSEVEQPIVKGIYAYDLNYTEDDNAYTLNYKVTDDAPHATIVLTPRDGGEAITIDAGAALKAGNQVTVNKNSLTPDMKYDWKVIVDNKAIPSIQKFFKTANSTGRGITMDLNPESKFFGNLYVGDPYTAGKKGLYVYSPDLTLQNAEPYFTSEFAKGNTGSPFRLSVHPNGTVFIADWSDAHAGLWEFNPEDTQNLTNFFEGIKDKDGRYTVGDVAVGGSTTSSAIFGTGNETTLLVFNEDYTPGTSKVLCRYNIGDKMTWGEAASATYPKVSAKLINGNVNIVADQEGMWLSQLRGSGNNDAGVPSFIYADYDDNILFNSGTPDTPAKTHVNGSWGSGLAVNAEKTLLAVADDKPNIVVFELTWEGKKPVLSYKYTIKYPAGPDRNIINQLVFDPAGNLFAGNRYQDYAFALPKESQKVTTPAASSLYLLVKAPTAVNEVTAEKEIVSVQYVNTSGMSSNQPFEGVNIVITKYADGTTSTTKVIK